MTDEAAFYRAIFSAPDDDLPVLLFADWLDERGDDRGQYLRQFPKLYRVVAELRGERRSAAPVGDFMPSDPDAARRFLTGLILVLAAHRFDPEFRPGEPCAADQILRSVARFMPPSRGLLGRALRPERASVKRLMAILADRPPLPDEQHTLAARLTAVQSPSVLTGLWKRFSDSLHFTEFFTALSQEMALRGHDLTQSTEAERFHQRLRDGGHPLAELPLRPHAIERDLAAHLPRVVPGAMPVDRPFGPTREITTHGVPADGPDPRILSELPDAEITVAVDRWVAESHAVADGRRYQLDGGGRVTRDWLRALNSRYVARANREYVRTEIVTPREVMTVLFAAAANGGVYPSGRGGAYGRWAAWRSLAALAGLSLAEALTADLQQWSWIYFDTAWEDLPPLVELGVVCVRPDGRSAAVLTATDAD